MQYEFEEYKSLKQQQNIQRNRPRITSINPTSSQETVAKDQTSSDSMNMDIQRYDGDDYSYPIKLIPHIKCHYCDLHFHNEKEQKEHELELHV